MYKNYADILPTAISHLFVRNDVYHDHYTKCQQFTSCAGGAYGINL